MSLTVLHLSDIHAGPGELRDEDFKEELPAAHRAGALARLTSYLQCLANVPDYVVITGDITIRGDPAGFGLVRKWLLERISEKLLPSADRILVVPGNHDVRWKVPDGPDFNRARYEHFWNAFGTTFPHSHIPHYDPALDPQAPSFNSSSRTLIGGVRTRARLGQVEVVTSHPFLLDLTNDLLLFAFNSTLASGIVLPGDPAITGPLRAVAAITQDDDTRRAIEGVMHAYSESLIVDAGLCGDEQLNYFSVLMRRMRKVLGARYGRLTKIALLHHHVSHLWRQQLEVKNFEFTVDAAQLKQFLTESEFDFVLHGHKHTNNVSVDASIIPVSQTRALAPLCVVSAGTVGGHPRVGDRQTFKLLTFDETKGPRRAARITEIPLVDSAAPGTVMRDEATIYHVPVSSRLPELHESPDVKTKLDEFLLGTLAPEVGGPAALVHSGTESRLPPANARLVGEVSRYKFIRVLESDSGHTFYDVVLATARLDFRHRARIYWMLTDVDAWARKRDAAVHIKLLIGDLGATHFSRELVPGEVKPSVDLLTRWFEPAVRSGLLELRVHDFLQSEIEDLARAAAEPV